MWLRVFEGPQQLLDWGACFYPPGGDEGAAIAGKKIASLLKVFFPSVIVVKKVLHKTTRNSSGVHPILKAIYHEASIRSIPVRFLSRTEVRGAFRIFRGETKHEIASILAGIFPDLLWKLPSKRKIYEGEHPAMSIFDAVALGFAHWQLNGAQVPPPE